MLFSAFLSNRRVSHALTMPFLACAALLCVSEPGYAQAPADASTVAPPDQSFLQSFLTQPTMTGDWGGLRTRLAQEGFNFRASYIGEWAYNFSGGKRIGGDYAQQFAFGADVDMDKVAGLTGGTFHISFNAREGRNASADFIGNKIDVSEIYGDGNNFRFAELSYQQALYNDLVDLKGGFFVMGDDFGRTAILCDFENDAFCAHPTSLPNNSGWSDYPAGKWGARVKLNLPGDIYAETGVFEVNPTYADFNNGFKLSLNGSTGVLVPLEFSKTVKLGSTGLVGHYKFGAYYDSSHAADVTNPGISYSGRYGYYALADQMLVSFEPGTDRGLIAVANVTVSDKRTSTIPTFFTLALVAQGPLAVRPHDFIAVGYVRDYVNSNVINKQNALLESEGITDPNLALGENIVEVAYGLQATPWMQINPNVQYIGNPGAFTFKHTPDAWVFGVHVGLKL
jgi:porin